MKKTLTEIFTEFKIGAFKDKVGTVLTPKHYNTVVTTSLGIGLVEGMNKPTGRIYDHEKTIRLIVKLTNPIDKTNVNESWCFWMSEVVLTNN
jgi:hypothetical protein